jgi:hypothetical protein
MDLDTPGSREVFTSTDRSVDTSIFTTGIPINKIRINPRRENTTLIFIF